MHPHIDLSASLTPCGAVTTRQDSHLDCTVDEGFRLLSALYSSLVQQVKELADLAQIPHDRAVRYVLHLYDHQHVVALLETSQPVTHAPKTSPN